ncbi:MAG TPA: ribonuclease P protein component [Pirellulales bacterium]
MSDKSFPKQLRLRTRGDFRHVYERRCSSGDGLLRMLGMLTELPHPRIGLSISRKLGNAVARNRWKRLLREAFRLSREKLPVGIDFIVIPCGAGEPQLQPLQKSLVDLAWRLRKRLQKDQSAARRAQCDEESRAEAQRRGETEK